MAWTTPRTWVSGEVVTASLLNAHLRDNLNALGFDGDSFSSIYVISTGCEIVIGYGGAGGLAIATGSAPTAHPNGVVLWVSGTTLYARKPNGTDVALG